MTLPPTLKLAEVVPDLKSWNEGKGIEPEDWLAMLGSVPQALMYSVLFWPTFVEHQGCLLREGFSPQLFQEWLTRTNGDRTAVELVMNHRHITDFFPNAEEHPSPEQIAYWAICCERSGL
ncbi:hypothetical protein F8S09_11815 [Deinococcus sp. SDU3-2]|uniref:Uncharacterized protein n=1 Tax=Deinococcus terrestris TaxID=2651870 RepID=A0A7X1NWY6_9DEIO|nr:hypothetical protein [Deinococcus terrestris]MPY67366.1 hypothetical protein [Deinococcus terrestris]